MDQVEGYVLTAGQQGRHNDERVTYGPSVIVDPSGTVVAEAADRECVILADIGDESRPWATGRSA